MRNNANHDSESEDSADGGDSDGVDHDAASGSGSYSRIDEAIARMQHEAGADGAGDEEDEESGGEYERKSGGGGGGFVHPGRREAEPADHGDSDGGVNMLD